MRTDLLKSIKFKPYYSWTYMARIYKCDVRTIKKYVSFFRKEKLFHKRRSKLFKDELQVKIEEIVKDKPTIRASRLYRSMQYDSILLNPRTNKKYNIRTFRRRVEKAKKKYGKKAEVPILINHKEGEEFQVDWKESLKLVLTTGEIINFNVLGIVSPYSGKLALIPTFNRKQYSLLHALAQGIEKFQGVPNQIKFDNMKTVVDYTKSTRKNKVYNNKILQFGNDYNMRITSTEPFNPQGKGTIETKMKFLDNLDIHDNKLNSWNDLVMIIKDLENEANEKVNKEEKLNPLPRQEIKNHYLKKRVQIKVARTSTILYKGLKYSVEPRFIGTKCWIEEKNKHIYIYNLYGNLIRKYQISNKVNNYDFRDFKDIIKQPKYIKYKKENETIEEFINKQFKLLGES